MWIFGKKSARRREIRRSKAKLHVTLRQKLLDQVAPWPLATAIFFGAFAALIINTGGDVLPYRVGMTVPSGINSRIPFKVVDQQATETRRTQARDSAPTYYIADTLLLDDIRGRLANAIQLAKTHAADSEQLKSEAAKIDLPLDDAAVSELQRLAALPPDQREYQNMIESTIELLIAQPLVEVSELAGRRRPPQAVMVYEKLERTFLIAELIVGTLENADAEADRVAGEAAQGMSPPLRAGFKSLIAAALRGSDSDVPLRPVYHFDPDRTHESKSKAEAGVKPLANAYEPEDRLADAGVIDQSEKDLLIREHAAYRMQVRQSSAWSVRAWLAILGRSLLAFLIAAGVAIYVATDRARQVSHPLRLAGVAVIVLGMLGLARFTIINSHTLPAHFAVGAQAFAVAILCIVYSQRFTFGTSGALALLITVATAQDAGFFAILLTVTAVMILGLRNIRNRGKIVLVGLIGGAMACGVTVAVGLINGQVIKFILWQGAWAGGTTLAAAFVIEGVLPFIERLFRLSTNVTLLEWCDANKTLLRTLATKAPGTYNHSLLMGSMAESAAEAIGANGLLTRTGAYYHDIGKINKPHYFIENATTAASRHEGLSPAMSLLIIIAHVKDGIEMAKEYNLPASLHPFIAEHHGTTLVEYFYHAANKERKAEDPEVADSQFRYPGPKPQSRETAIVMLCDGVEGAVRSMSDPNPSRIETLVGEIARKRLLDGQFDECELNFRELAAIEDSLVKSLCGIYHSRIVYPTAEEKTA